MSPEGADNGLRVLAQREQRQRCCSIQSSRGSPAPHHHYRLREPEPTHQLRPAPPAHMERRGGRMRKVTLGVSALGATKWRPSGEPSSTCRGNSLPQPALSQDRSGKVTHSKSRATIRTLWMAGPCPAANSRRADMAI